MNRNTPEKNTSENPLNKKQLFLYLLVFLLITCVPFSGYGQYTVQWPDKHDVRSVRLMNPDRTDGFIVSLSLVALFTSGTQDRDGFRIGFGFNLAYHMDQWIVFSGLDFYKAEEECFGIGTSYSGCSFFNGNIGGSYLVNRYFQGAKQISSIIGLRTKDFELKFEDDILAIPFTGFKIQDRFRTAAIELRYKRVLLGVNVYTTDIDGVTDFSFSNKKGAYRQGKQISSPVYVGYTDYGVLVRYGLNNYLGGILGQNGWHRSLFDTPDFNKGTYHTHFLQIGTYQSYTLY